MDEGHTIFSLDSAIQHRFVELHPSIAFIGIGNIITFIGSCWLAFHNVSFCCILSQLSAEVLVALLIRKAISGLKAAFSFTNSDKVFLLTPNIFAASVTDNPNGFSTSSKNTLPGWVGFLVMIHPSIQ